jgi:hypothetical protein
MLIDFFLILFANLEATKLGQGTSSWQRVNFPVFKALSW